MALEGRDCVVGLGFARGWEDRSRVCESRPAAGPPKSVGHVPDESATSAARALLDAAVWFASRGVRIERVLTDSAWACTSPTYERAAASTDARHKRTQPHRPQTNGKPERFIKTVLAEWAYGRLYRSNDERLAALSAWGRLLRRRAHPHGPRWHHPTGRAGEQPAWEPRPASDGGPLQRRGIGLVESPRRPELSRGRAGGNVFAATRRPWQRSVRPPKTVEMRPPTRLVSWSRAGTPGDSPAKSHRLVPSRRSRDPIRSGALTADPGHRPS